MHRFWFRVSINEDPRKVVKAIIQAKDYDSAVEILKSAIDQYYPGYPDFDILTVEDILPDDSSYIVIGDGEGTHFSSMIKEGR